MNASRSIVVFAVLSFLAVVLAALPLTGALGPAMAVGAMHLILLRIFMAVRTGAPALKPVRVPAGRRRRPAEA